MKVLKFGGTSVASSGVINQVREISANSNADRIAVVVSALGGVTDLLLDTMHTASRQDASFRKALKVIEDRHLEVVRELLPTKAQSGVLSKVKSELNVLETLLEGAYYIGEVTPRLSDKVVSYGELLSAFIISEYFKVSGLDAVFKDSRELLITDQTHGKAVVDFKETDKRIIQYFEEEKAKVVILPGFIAS